MDFLPSPFLATVRIAGQLPKRRTEAGLARTDLLKSSRSVTLMRWMATFKRSAPAVRCQANQFGNLSNQVSSLCRRNGRGLSRSKRASNI